MKKKGTKKESLKDKLLKGLDLAYERMIAEKRKNQQKIVFIHGKGEGVLRRAIIRELNYRYKKYHFQDASFREYGYGATQVTIIT